MCQQPRQRMAIMVSKTPQRNTLQWSRVYWTHLPTAPPPCRHARIKSKPTTSHNPQGSSLIESIHKSIGHVLCMLIHIHHPQTKSDATSLAKQALATAMHASFCTVNHSLNNLSPGAIIFRRAMFLDIPFISDIITLTCARQTLIDNRLLKENACRISHDYKINDHVLKKSILSFSDKMQPSFTGLYQIEQVHTNGTRTIRLSPNQTECINIRRLKPYKVLRASWCGRVKHPCRTPSEAQCASPNEELPPKRTPRCDSPKSDTPPLRRFPQETYVSRSAPPVNTNDISIRLVLDR